MYCSFIKLCIPEHLQNIARIHSLHIVYLKNVNIWTEVQQNVLLFNSDDQHFEIIMFYMVARWKKERNFGFL